MTLAEQIDALRLKALAAAEDEDLLVRTLAAELEESGRALELAVDHMIAGEYDRRLRLVGKLELLSRRVGHLPAPVDITPERPPPLPHQRDVPPLEMRFRPFIAEAAE